jgi:DNA-binding transcriptional LysR family regulator
MLDLRRLRLLRELEARGTIAAVADALQFTPSAVSQQLAVLERETGVSLFERAGRGVRLTDAGHVLAARAAGLLADAEAVEAELAAVSGRAVGRGRIAAFQSVSMVIAAPAIAALAREEPGVRCELVEAEPEESLPALALGDYDLVLADEWQNQPRPAFPGLDRVDLHHDRVRIVMPAAHPLARRHRRAVPIAELADELWISGPAGAGWAELTEWACRSLGGFEPRVRHRTNDGIVTQHLVARGLAVALLPDLATSPGLDGVALRDIAEGDVGRTIFAATRAVDARRPAVQALLAAVRDAV